MSSSAWKPTPGQVALIELAEDSEKCLTGVVMDNGNGAVVIDLGASPAPPSDDTAVIASFFTPEALYRVRARAHPRADQHAVIDLNVEEVERVQRRESPRSRVELKVALTAFDGEASAMPSVVGTTVDVGPGGCRVRTENQFPPGHDPTITIHLPDGGDMVALGQVLQATHDRGAWEYRMAFMDIDEGDAKRLAELD
jgi:hypothetical protein